MNQNFEEAVREDLYRYLLSVGEVDERLPECLDVEEMWRTIAESYIADGIREFAEYPMVSLGWMMYIGMSVAEFWDSNWEYFLKIDDFYAFIRDKRGYDYLDDYVRDEVLKLDKTASDALEILVGECASRTYSLLRHSNLEPGTKAAFEAYISCLHQLYLFGAAVQLKRLGYKMTNLSEQA